jgi:hypothetical protein
VDLYANGPTDVVIDINGYYVPDGYVSTGTYNTAVGSGALVYNTTGTYNTAVGQEALQANTDGLHNTATGGAALFAIAPEAITLLLATERSIKIRRDRRTPPSAAGRFTTTRLEATTSPSGKPLPSTS